MKPVVTGWMSIALASTLLALPAAAQQSRVLAGHPRLRTLNGPLVYGVDGSVEEFAISPDGAWLVYLADQEAQDHVELYSGPLDGSSAAIRLNLPIASFEDVLSFAISADSSRVVYAIGFDLFSVPIGGGAVTRLDESVDPALVVSPYFRIAPDSSRVVFLADPDDYDSGDLFSVPIDGGTATKLCADIAPGGPQAVQIGFEVSPDSSSIVFIGDLNTNAVFELYAVPLAGGTIVRLNSALGSGGDVLGFAIAPDSSRVVYRADPNDPVVELHSVPLAGGTPVVLNGPVATQGTPHAGFQISADSARVVYVGEFTFQNEALCSAPIDGSAAATRLFDPAAHAVDVGVVSIAPDGATVVFLADLLDDSNPELFSVAVGGGSPTRLNAPVSSDGQVHDFAISGDALHVVYRQQLDGTGIVELFSVPIAGGASTKLSPTLAGTSDVATLFAIAPDSSSVVFRADAEVDERIDLYLAPLDGSVAAMRISPTPGPGGDDVLEGRFTPDSASVVFTGKLEVATATEIYRVSAARGAATKLNGPLDPTSWPVGDVQSWQSSADGQWAVYVSDEQVDERFELYSVELATGARTKLNLTLASAGDVAQFAIAPDASRVAYQADPDGSDFEWISVPIAGGASVALFPSLATTTVSGSTSVQIAHDGSVAVLSHPSGLWSAPLVGGSEVQLTPALAPGTTIDAFAISGDDSRVVYLGDQDTDNVVQVYSVSLSGGASVRLNPALSGARDVRSFVICGDSTSVVYLADQTLNDVDELFGVPIGGGTAVQLNHALALGEDVSTYQVSPDSTRAVFRAGGPGANDPQRLFSVSVAGGTSVRLDADPPLHDQVTQAFLISPDSARVIYRARNPGTFELFSVPLAGGSTPVKISNGITGPINGAVAISADSSRVAFVSYDGSHNELYSVPLAGGTPLDLSHLAPNDTVNIQVRVGGSPARALYTVNFSGPLELFGVRLDGSAPPLKLSPPLLGGAGLALSHFDFTGERVLFLFTTQLGQVTELLMSELSAQARPFVR